MEKKIVLGITQGDTNGIGYEVIIKALSDARMLDSCIPVLYGSSRFFGIYRKIVPETEQIATNIINGAKDARPKRINIINAVGDNLAIDIGQPTLDGAKGAILSLEAAVRDLKEGTIDAIVTAPFNKHTVNDANFHFPGHTEYLINEFGVKDGLMLLCNDRMKVGVLTNHLPIAKVAQAVTTDAILSKLRLMNSTLIRDFGADRPKIAVLGLNPHAGDGGTLGMEEIEQIIPAVKAANDENILQYLPPLQVRCSTGDVPRPGAHPVQGARFQYGSQLHSRPSRSPHFARPRNGIRHRGKGSRESRAYDFSDKHRTRHSTQPRTL